MDNEQVKEKILDIVSEKLDRPRDGITTQMSFVNDLGADSLDTVELMMEIEDAFDLDIPDEDAQKIDKIQDAIDYVMNAVSNKEDA